MTSGLKKKKNEETKNTRQKRLASVKKTFHTTTTKNREGRKRETELFFFFLSRIVDGERDGGDCEFYYYVPVSTLQYYQVRRTHTDWHFSSVLISVRHLGRLLVY